MKIVLICDEIETNYLDTEGYQHAFEIMYFFSAIQSFIRKNTSDNEKIPKLHFRIAGANFQDTHELNNELLSEWKRNLKSKVISYKKLKKEKNGLFLSINDQIAINVNSAALAITYIKLIEIFLKPHPHPSIQSKLSCAAKYIKETFNKLSACPFKLHTIKNKNMNVWSYKFKEGKYHIPKVELADLVANVYSEQIDLRNIYDTTSNRFSYLLANDMNHHSIEFKKMVAFGLAMEIFDSISMIRELHNSKNYIEIIGCPELLYDILSVKQNNNTYLNNLIDKSELFDTGDEVDCNNKELIYNQLSSQKGLSQKTVTIYNKSYSLEHLLTQATKQFLVSEITSKVYN